MCADHLPRSRILVADDDRAIRESLDRALRLDGYEVLLATDGVQTLARMHAEPVDLLVLDVAMPRVDGLGVCEVLRAEGNQVPILMLTARVTTPDRVAGLDAGADDYVPKPFELDEFLARVRALLRRAGPVGAPQPHPGTAAAAHAESWTERQLQVADLRLDAGARRAWRGHRELELSKTEFDLLELLLRNAGIVLDRSTIYDRIWGYDFGPESKNLAVYISYLRRKLERDGEPQLIHTVRGVGYTIRAE
ncbi:response regulator transcription factor [Lipingzhangella sp. LS1_29]|uniref:Response regulator transcription factor n=1 Tax=Lipingzhangella rawalii TaxID=2055835 RepID=A0ABU2H4W2_9ACTN|nr:response regulator transcription factor [Lipingzhangella rawalii]MDS1269880.1 response regulator transcription factor [Lipingzhangella rawalii]